VAYKQAAKTKGEGDAEADAHDGAAYSKNRGFINDSPLEVQEDFRRTRRRHSGTRFELLKIFMRERRVSEQRIALGAGCCGAPARSIGPRMHRLW